MTDVWAPLAQEYAANRKGYSNEIYDAIANFGLRRAATILDVGCGTGIASEPFAANGFPVTGVDASPAMLEKAKERLPNADFVQANAEALPFPNERFDVVISAQAFHWFERAKALSEAHRVLRPGGLLAIWWKHLMSQERLSEIRAETFKSLGAEPPASGLSGGFREFYGSEQFFDQTLRVIPWRTSMPLDHYLGYERSRRSTYDALGSRAESYFSLLEQRLSELAGPGNPTISVAYTQYLYLAKKR